MQTLLKEEARKIYTVTEVTRDIRGLLEDNFPSLWICGEISNFKQASSGHFYFTLKDDRSQISSVMFKGANVSLKFIPEDGLEVIVHGRVSVYEPRGSYQMIVDYLEPKGLGALKLAFEQLKKKLEAEGLFDPRHKKPIPYLPKKIGIITSLKGAVLHDMVTILTRRHPNIQILVNPVTVQGEGAAGEIAMAIAEMNARLDIDLLIVGRGGGSMEDLWAFNEEIVARTIFESDIPIISAVGHETDYTLADLAADLRAPTPSAAAELAVPDREELLSSLGQQTLNLRSVMKNYLKRLKERILSLKKQVKSPERFLKDARLKVDDLKARLVAAQNILIFKKRQMFREIVLAMPDFIGRLKELRARLEALHRHLEAVSPLHLLKRGYSIVFKEEKAKAVRSVSEISVGDRLVLQLSDGRVDVSCIGK